MNDSYVDLQMDMHRVQELDELVGRWVLRFPLSITC